MKSFFVFFLICAGWNMALPSCFRNGSNIYSAILQASKANKNYNLWHPHHDIVCSDIMCVGAMQSAIAASTIHCTNVYQDQCGCPKPSLHV